MKVWSPTFVARPSPTGFHHRVAYWLVDYDDLPQPRHWARFCGQVRKRITSTSAPFWPNGRSRPLHHDVYRLQSLWLRIRPDHGVLVQFHWRRQRNRGGGSAKYIRWPPRLRTRGVTPTAVQTWKRLCTFPPQYGDGSYRIEVSDPLSTIAVSVTLDQPGQEPFVTTVLARRRPSTMAPILRSLMRRSGLRTRWLIQREGSGSGAKEWRYNQDESGNGDERRSEVWSNRFRSLA